MITHKGSTAKYGHYTCFCHDNSWIYYDDIKFVKMNEMAVKLANPFLLFYKVIE